jgi:predicted phosphodiesterase
VTRLAILADIHGNLPALEAVEADLAGFAVDQVVVAGDLINWGPFSAQVTERVLAAGWAVLRGNAEYYLLDYGTPRAPAVWNDPVAFPLLPWLRRQLSPVLQVRIATWPDMIVVRPPDAPPLRIVHGSPRSPFEAIRPQVTEAELAPMLAGIEEETIIAGHTHVAMDRQVGRWRVLNPGSVGVPLDGQFFARYLLLDGDASGWRATFRQAPFSNEAVFAEFARQRFAEECGVIGHFVLDEFRTARLGLAPFLRWRQAVCPNAPLNDETLARFRTVDPDLYTAAHHLAARRELARPRPAR